MLLSPVLLNISNAVGTKKIAVVTAASIVANVNNLNRLNRTLKSFMIGYSGKFDELYRLLKSKGFKDEEILASSLVNKTDDGKYIDRFRRRLMFPIQDIRGRVIAFGGSVLDDSNPNYIYSPENIVYSKGKQLFGLNIAKKGDTKRIIIVEGYMDAIS